MLLGGHGDASRVPVCGLVLQMKAMDPHATIEDLPAEGFTHDSPRCRMTRLRPVIWLPRISMGLTTAQLSARAELAALMRSAGVPVLIEI